MKSTAAHRRPASIAMLAMLAGCAADPSTQAPPVGIEIAPRATCRADAVSPQFVATQAAVLPSAAFERGRGWASRLAFSVDERGAPAAIHVQVDGEPDDALAEAVVAAFAGYRFCAPVAYSTATRWTAQMRFRPLLASKETGEAEGFVQMFIPAYTRDEVREGHTGTVRVAGTFGDDGRVTAVRLVATSGDAVLDRKSLDAIASWQIAFRPGSAPRAHPLVLDQPFKYEIRGTP